MDLLQDRVVAVVSVQFLYVKLFICKGVFFQVQVLFKFKLVIEILTDGRQGPVYPTQTIPWLLMAWRRQEAGHHQPWYWPCSPRIFRLQPQDRRRNCLLHSLHWRHNGRDGISNHQSHDCLLNGLFRCRSKKTSKPRVTGLCARNSPVTGEFPAQRPVTRKMLPFDDVIMLYRISYCFLFLFRYLAFSKRASCDGKRWRQ